MRKNNGQTLHDKDKQQSSVLKCSLFGGQPQVSGVEAFSTQSLHHHMLQDAQH